MGLLKKIGRVRRRTRSNFAKAIARLDDDKIYTLVNKAGQKMTRTGKEWKAGFDEV